MPEERIQKDIQPTNATSNERLNMLREQIKVVFLPLALSVLPRAVSNINLWCTLGHRKVVGALPEGTRLVTVKLDEGLAVEFQARVFGLEGYRSRHVISQVFPRLVKFQIRQKGGGNGPHIHTGGSMRRVTRKRKETKHSVRQEDTGLTIRGLDELQVFLFDPG